MTDKKTPEFSIGLALLIGSYVTVKIAFKCLFLPHQTPMITFNTDDLFLSVQLANFMLFAVLTTLWWATVIVAASRLIAFVYNIKLKDAICRFLPQAWIIIACEPLNFFMKNIPGNTIRFWPVTNADILAATVLLLSVGYYIFKKTSSKNGTLLTLPLLIIAPTVLAAIPPQATALVLYAMIINPKKDAKTLRPITVMSTLILFFLGIVLYRHHVTAYALENIFPLALTVIAALGILRLITNEKENKNRLACGALFCAGCAGTPILLLAGLALSFFILYRNITRIISNNFWIKNTFLAQCANIVILSGWVFAKGQMADYPQIFLAYTLCFFIFFINSLELKDSDAKPILTLNALGCFLGFMLIPELLLITNLYWIMTPLAVAISIGHFVARYGLKIKQASISIALVAASIALIIS